MKQLFTTIRVVLLLLLAANGFSQTNNRNLLFSNYPGIINCTDAQLANFFTGEQGQTVSVAFDSQFTLQGTITSKIKNYSNLQTVVVKLSAFNNISFSISKRIDENNQAVYRGHLVNKAYTDGYELSKSTTGNYEFVKVETEKLLPTCSQ